MSSSRLNSYLTLCLAVEEERRRQRASDPASYLVDRLGFDRKNIIWSEYPEYAGHKWDGDPDPLKRICDVVASFKWCGVESATGTGKTYLAAGLALWFLESFKDSMVITVAPKEAQLKLNIWKEIGKLYRRFDLGELLSLQIKMNENSDLWSAFAFVCGVGANEEIATKAQGFHAEHMLIIFEETPGINQSIIDAFQNTCTGPKNTILALGNPDSQLDSLAKFCRRPDVVKVRISGYDHPNVVTSNPSLIPGAQSRAGLDRLAIRYGGTDHPLYMSRARGITPVQDAFALIKYEWCMRAVERGRLIPETSGIDALGVDVANSEGGDEASIAKGSGRSLVEVSSFQCPDASRLGHEVIAMMTDFGIEDHKVGVDGVGVGASTINTMKEQGRYVSNLIGSAQPEFDDDSNEYNNIRSQMWWQMREALRSDIITLPDDMELVTDLVTPKWSVKSGKTVVESKEDIKKRLGRSPNKGDAAVYWNAVRVGMGQGSLNIAFI